MIVFLTDFSRVCIFISMKKFILKKEEDTRGVSYSIDYEKELNDPQFEAVSHKEGPALVIAGAGTGKTRTLIYRVARLIEQGVAPGNILLLTFTRRAAREMLERAGRVLDQRCSKVNGGTFHYYCSRLLHRYAERMGFPENFTILDSSDAIEVIQLLRTELNAAESGKRFPRKNTIYNMLSSAANKQLGLHEIVDSQYPQFREHIDKIEQIAQAYSAYKKKSHVMDFDDLLVQTRDMLRQHKDICQQVSAENRYVMIDEYQDTNALQAELAGLFTWGHNNIMAVGDDAQSIYAFRGADHKNIMEFPNLFRNTRIIKLEENYRSTQRILDLANRLLEQAKDKYDKRLFTNREEGDLPALIKAPDERDQSRFISQMILTMREQGKELREMAVLFRNGRDSFELELELNRKKIPFIKYGGVKFAEAAHIKDVLAHLKVLVNPADAISWNRVLTLLEGIGPKTAADLVAWLTSAQNPYAMDGMQRVSGKYKKQLDSLSMLLTDLKHKDFTTSEIVEHVVNYYRSFCEKRFDDHPKRVKDLETFVGLAQNFTDLDQILNDLSLDPIEQSAVDFESTVEDEAPLVLSTIHSAKGLEWSQVFLIQCLDGILPSGYSIDDADSLDEELRLMYVACTRAADNLYISYPVLQNNTYGEYFSNPSRFIADIGEKELEPWVLVEERDDQQALPPNDAPALPE